MPAVADLTLAYGSTYQQLRLPDAKAEFLAPKQTPAVPNIEEAVRYALRNPTGKDQLRELLRGKRRVVICISDGTRQCAYPQTLPILLDELNKGGVPDKGVNLVIATGSHRAMGTEEIRKHLGDAVCRRVKVHNHDCHHTSGLIRSGKTDRGTVLYYNKMVSDADFLILASSITYHYFAGFTGGRKALFPGCAGFDSIVANHSLTIDHETGTFNPKCRAGILTGNPIHEDTVDAALQLDPDFMMDAVLNTDGEIAGVFAGDFSYAHRVGCYFVEDRFGIRLQEKYPLVIASCGGFPKDINLYQAHKSMEFASYGLKPKGTLILLAECREGMGHSGFEHWVKLPTMADISDELRSQYRPIGHLALALRRKTEEFNVILVSSITPEVLKPWGIKPAASLSDAMAMAADDGAPMDEPAVIPNASVTVPISGDQILPKTDKHGG